MKNYYPTMSIPTESFGNHQRVKISIWLGRVASSFFEFPMVLANGDSVKI